MPQEFALGSVHWRNAGTNSQRFGAAPLFLVVGQLKIPRAAKIDVAFRSLGG